MVRLVDDEDGHSTSLGVLGGQRVGGLWDERRGVKPGCLAEGGDDGQRDDGEDDRVLSRGLSSITLDPKANELLIR